MSSAVLISSLLSAVHVLTLAVGLGAIGQRGRALAGPLDDEAWRQVLTADTLWGIAAVLWIASGLGRVFFGGRQPAFYAHNGFFWVKMALFALVFLLEIAPMTTFMRVRAARRRGAALPRFNVVAYRRINAAETGLVVTIVHRGIHGSRCLDVLKETQLLARLPDPAVDLESDASGR